MRKREVKDKECLYCSSPVTNKFCSSKCQKDYQYTRYIDRWKEGLESGWKGRTRQLSRYIRRYLHETRGSKCSVCEWDERHHIDGAILTEINHIDGNAENNVESNLEILCPNCHSKTSTFRARNKVSTRTRNAPII